MQARSSFDLTLLSNCLQVIQAAAQYVPDLAGAECQQVTAGLMPYPVDAHPIVGYSRDWPNLYVAVTHSGATLAPLIGNLVSQEIVDKQDADLLKPYRLQRDFSDLNHIY